MSSLLRARIAACLFLLAAACHKPQQETLLIAGNSALARYLEPVVKEFHARNPSANVVCEQGGTTAAVIAVKRSAIDIAALSRQVTAEEDDSFLRDYQVCRDAFAIIVNPANPVGELTMKHLDEIFDGITTKWKPLGGPDLPIAVYIMDRASRSSHSFNELVLGGDEPFPGAITTANSTEMMAVVKKNPGAIGFITSKHAGTTEVKKLKIEGVEMTRATVLSGRYPLSRTFYLGVYMEPSPLAREFVEFALSKDGQELFEKGGLMPVHSRAAATPGE